MPVVADGLANCAAAACSWKDDKAVVGCLGSGVIDMLGCCCLDDLGPGCCNNKKKQNVGKLNVCFVGWSNLYDLEDKFTAMELVASM